MKTLKAECSGCGQCAVIDIDNENIVFLECVRKPFPFWPLIPSGLFCVHCGLAVCWEVENKKEKEK